MNINEFWVLVILLILKLIYYRSRPSLDGQWVLSAAPVRSLAILIASGLASMPIHRRPARCAATSAVPLPQNGSSTTSPGLLLALMMRSSKAMGFWVG